MPITRFLLNFETMNAACAIASSGLVTTIMMQFGEYLATCSVAVLHDFVIGQQQVVAAHARLAREAGGDDRDVGIRRRLVIVRAGDADVVALDRAGLQQVEPLALRNTFDHVDQNDIGQFLVGNAQRAIRADISGAHNRDFLSQNRLLLSGGITHRL